MSQPFSRSLLSSLSVFAMASWLTPVLAQVSAGRPKPVPPPPPFDDAPVQVDVVFPDGSHMNMDDPVYVQLPLDPSGHDPLLVIFHGSHYDQHWSNGAYPLMTELNALMNAAATRGWIAVSPLALSPLTIPLGDHSSYGNPLFDQCITAVIDAMDSRYMIDGNRIYTFGYSMGGADATSYAARHLDPTGRRIAAVWSMSGVHDSTVNNPAFFWASGAPDQDPLPFLASSIWPIPNNPPGCTGWATWQNFPQDWAQVYNLQGIKVKLTTTGSNDICSCWATVNDLNLNPPIASMLDIDTSYNSNHHTLDDFDPVQITGYLGGATLTTPSAAYRTVALKDGRYGYFDVTLASPSAPALFGHQIDAATNRLYFSYNGQGTPSGVSEIGFRIDQGTDPDEPSLVSTSPLLIFCTAPGDAITLVIKNCPGSPQTVVPPSGGTWSFLGSELTLTPGGPGQQDWSVTF